MDNFKDTRYREVYISLLHKVLQKRLPYTPAEDLLEQESVKIGCLFFNPNQFTFGLNKAEYVLTRSGLEELDQGGDMAWFLHEEAEGGDEEMQSPLNYITLGRPITLCELVDVLNDNIEDEENIDEYGYYYHLNAIYKMDYVISYTGTTVFLPKKQIEFQKNTYHLHEQPQAVLDKIIKLLK